MKRNNSRFDVDAFRVWIPRSDLEIDRILTLTGGERTKGTGTLLCRAVDDKETLWLARQSGSEIPGNCRPLSKLELEQLERRVPLHDVLHPQLCATKNAAAIIP